MRRRNDDDEPSWAYREWSPENDGPDEGGTASWEETEELELATCPKCRCEFYAEAESCPRCGHYLTEDDRRGPSYPPWIILTASICLVAILASVVRMFQ